MLSTPHLLSGRRRPRVAALLMLVMLIPVTVLASLTGTAAVKSWSDRRHAIAVQRDAMALAELMAARAAVTDEYDASAALVEAAAFHITPTQITNLFGVDYSKLLVQARPRVDEAD